METHGHRQARSALLALMLSSGTWAPAAAVLADAAPGDGSDPVARWFAISDAAKESQPHWMTPLITVTPRLEQEFRYDESWQVRAKDTQIANDGNGKGVEIIPLPNTEVILGIPAYEVKHTPKGDTRGFADETLLLKYRLLSGNEEHGNYIVTAFLGASLPTGSTAFTVGKGVITPTLAAGKGWGGRDSGIDVQSTVGVAVPVANEGKIGTTVAWNTSFQGHVGKLWPEFETSYTSFHDGPNAGRNQLALTVGVIAGRFDLGPRVRLIAGGGYQWAVTSFSTFGHTWLGSVRVAF
jgi:hypothetical protein